DRSSESGWRLPGPWRAKLESGWRCDTKQDAQADKELRRDIVDGIKFPRSAADAIGVDGPSSGGAGTSSRAGTAPRSPDRSRCLKARDPAGDLKRPCMTPAPRDTRDPQW